MKSQLGINILPIFLPMFAYAVSGPYSGNVSAHNVSRLAIIMGTKALNAYYMIQNDPFVSVNRWLANNISAMTLFSIRELTRGNHSLNSSEIVLTCNS